MYRPGPLDDLLAEAANASSPPQLDDNSIDDNGNRTTTQNCIILADVTFRTEAFVHMINRQPMSHQGDRDNISMTSSLFLLMSVSSGSLPPLLSSDNGTTVPDTSLPNESTDNEASSSSSAATIVRLSEDGEGRLSYTVELPPTDYDSIEYRSAFEEAFGHSVFWNGTPGEELALAPDGPQRTQAETQDTWQRISRLPPLSLDTARLANIGAHYNRAADPVVVTPQTAQVPAPVSAGHAMRVCIRCGCYEPFQNNTDLCCRVNHGTDCVFADQYDHGPTPATPNAPDGSRRGHPEASRNPRPSSHIPDIYLFNIDANNRGDRYGGSVDGSASSMSSGDFRRTVLYVSNPTEPAQQYPLVLGRLNTHHVEGHPAPEPISGAPHILSEQPLQTPEPFSGTPHQLASSEVAPRRLYREALRPQDIEEFERQSLRPQLELIREGIRSRYNEEL